MANYFKDFAVVVVTLFIRECVPQLIRAYQKRYVNPKTAHRQMLLEQVGWLEERASKLAVFSFELTHNPPPDKFKLTLWMSKLDRRDREWAMKETDVEILRRCAEEKTAECRDNAAESSRLAEEVSNRAFLFPL